jgi:methionyl-tRNA formyltransferase
MRYIFAGDRDIAVWVLESLIKKGHYPLALLVSDPKVASHAGELIRLSGLPPENIFSGKDFLQDDNRSVLEALEADYIFGIHFPYLIPQSIIDIPKHGFLNLHPAYLPYNKGWHTPSWAIMENTPIGATLHFMAEELDAGDIIYQKKIDILPGDTANSLYARLKKLELEVFNEALPDIVSFTYARKQQQGAGTAHKKRDLLSPAIRQLDPDMTCTAQELILKLRGLTTNSIHEAAYYVVDGKKYFIQVTITEGKEE